jgi:hypothetical protein
LLIAAMLLLSLGVAPFAHPAGAAPEPPRIDRCAAVGETVAHWDTAYIAETYGPDVHVAAVSFTWYIWGTRSHYYLTYDATIDGDNARHVTPARANDVYATFSLSNGAVISTQSVLFLCR